MVALGVFMILVVALVLGMIIYGVVLYNGLVAVKHEVDRAWANIDVLLKQRHDELPKLMATCETYMQYEQETLKGIIAARNRCQSASSVSEISNANDEIHQGLARLFALAENYPDLKANTQFQELQRRISDLEDGIANRREFYNSSVNTFNIRIEIIPDVLMARLLNYKARDLFKVSDSERKDREVRMKVPKMSA